MFISADEKFKELKFIHWEWSELIRMREIVATKLFNVMKVESKMNFGSVN